MSVGQMHKERGGGAGEHVLVHRALLEATRAQDVSAEPPIAFSPGLCLNDITITGCVRSSNQHYVSLLWYERLNKSVEMSDATL